MNYKNIIVKSIAIITAVVFMVNTAALAGPVQKPLAISHKLLANIYIPEQYGRIEKSVNSKSPLVILMKDAHCVYEAQQNISRILDILIRDYKIDLVCVEGAVDKVDTSRLSSYADKEAREKVAGKYLKNGLFTAGEALSIKNGANPGFAIYGVEDAKLYWKDFQAFRDTVGGARINSRFLELIDNLVFQLKKKLYPTELLEFDNKADEYKNGKLSLTDWIKCLSNQKPVRPRLCRGAPNQKNLKLVMRSIKLEEKVDFKKVEIERAVLIRRLEKGLVKEDLRGLVKNSLLFKLGKISTLDYYSYLEGIGNAEMGENLRRYVKLVKIQARIDEDELFRELALIEEGIYRNLIPDEITGKLHRLDKDLDILKNILQLKANREELLYYKENRTNFTLDRFLDFIKIQAPLNAIPLPKEFNTPSLLEEVKKSISPSEEFYELALKRDEALVDNLLKRMDNVKKDKAILVCGGFHAEGIGKLLRDKGINLVTINPAITKAEEDSQKIYLSRMMDERINPVDILSQLGLGNIQPVVPNDTALPKTIGDLLLAGPEIDIQRLCKKIGVSAEQLRGLTIKDLFEKDGGLLEELEEEYVTTDDDVYAGFLELVFNEYNEAGPKERIDLTALKGKRENIQKIKSELIANFLMESLGGKGRLILLTLAKHSFGAGDISPERFMEELYSGGIEAVNRCLGIDIGNVVFSIIKTWQEAEKARGEGRIDNEAYRKMGEFLGIIDSNLGYVWHGKAPQFFAHLEELNRVIENVNNFPETMLMVYRERVYLSISDEINPNILDNIDFILSVINGIPEEIRARYKPYLYIYLHKEMDSIGESNVYHEKGGINLKMVDAIRNNQERRKILATIVVHEFFHKLIMGINAEGTDLIFPIRDWIDFLLLNGIGTVITEEGEVSIEEYLDLDKYGFKEVKRRLHRLSSGNIRYSHTPTRDVEGEYYKKEIADPQELLAHMIASEIFGRDNFVYYEGSFEVFDRHLLASSLSGRVYRYNRDQMKWGIKEETGFYSKDTTEGKGSIPWIEKRFGRFGFVAEELVFRLAPFWIMYFINISSPLAGGLCMAVISLIGGYIFIKLHPTVEDKKVALKIAVKNYLFLLIVFIKNLYSPISMTFLIISVLAIPLLVHFYENKYGGRTFLKWKWVPSKFIIWFLIITNPFILPNKTPAETTIPESEKTVPVPENVMPPQDGVGVFTEEGQTQTDLHVLNGREPLDHSLSELLYDWHMRHDKKFRKELKEEERLAKIKKLAEDYKKEGKYNPSPKEIEEYCGKIANLISPLMGDATWDDFSGEQMRFILEALLEAESDNEHWIVREKDGKPEVKVLGSGKGAYGISQITEIAVKELGRRVWLDLRIASGKTKASPGEKEKAGRRLKIIYQLLLTNDLSLQGYQNLDFNEVKRYFESIPDEKGKDMKDFGPLIQHTWDTWSFNLRAAAAIVFITFDYINAEMDKLGFKKGEYPILRLVILSFNWNYYDLIKKVKELKDKYGEDFPLSWYLVFIQTSEGPFHWFRFFDRYAQIAGYSLEGKEYCWVPPVVDYLARKVHDEKAKGVMREARWIINKLDFTLAEFVSYAEKKKLDLTKVGEYLGVPFGSKKWDEYIKSHYTLRDILLKGTRSIKFGRISKGVESELEARLELEKGTRDLVLGNDDDSKVKKAFNDAIRIYPLLKDELEKAKKLYETTPKVGFRLKAIEEEDYYCGGYVWSASRARYEFQFAKEIIEDAKEYDRQHGTRLYVEYLFHEALCHVLGHVPARLIQEKIFTENYDGQGSVLVSILGRRIRENINKKAQEGEKKRADYLEKEYGEKGFLKEGMEEFLEYSERRVREINGEGLGNRDYSYWVSNLDKAIKMDDYRKVAGAYARYKREGRLDGRILALMDERLCLQIKRYAIFAKKSFAGGDLGMALRQLGIAVSLIPSVELDPRQAQYDPFVQSLNLVVLSYFTRYDAADIKNLTHQIMDEWLRKGLLEIKGGNLKQARDTFETISDLLERKDYAFIGLVFPGYMVFADEMIGRIDAYEKLYFPAATQKMVLDANIFGVYVGITKRLLNGEILTREDKKRLCNIRSVNELKEILSGIRIKTSTWDEIFKILCIQPYPYLIGGDGRARQDEYRDLIGFIIGLEGICPDFKYILGELKESIQSYVDSFDKPTVSGIIANANKGGAGLSAKEREVIEDSVKTIDDVRRIIEGFATDSASWGDIFSIVIKKIQEFQEGLRFYSVIDIDEIRRIEGIVRGKAIDEISKARLILNLVALRKNLHILNNFPPDFLEPLADILEKFPGELLRAIRMPEPFTNDDLEKHILGVAGLDTMAAVRFDANKHLLPDGRVNVTELQETVWHELIHKASFSTSFNGEPTISPEVWRRIAIDGGFVGYLKGEGGFVFTEDDKSNLKGFRAIGDKNWIYQEGEGLVNYVPRREFSKIGKVVKGFLGKSKRYILIPYKDIGDRLKQKGCRFSVIDGCVAIEVRPDMGGDTHAKASPLELVAYAGTAYIKDSHEARVHPLYSRVIGYLEKYLFTFVENGVAKRYVFPKGVAEKIPVSGEEAKGARQRAPQYNGETSYVQPNGKKDRPLVYFKCRGRQFLYNKGDLDIGLGGPGGVTMLLKWEHVPEKGGFYYVLYWEIDGQQNKRVLVSGDRISIGRDSEKDIDIQLLNTRVSRSHLKIVVGDAGIDIEDLQSKNGTVIKEMKESGTHKTPGPTWTNEDWRLFKEQVKLVTRNQKPVTREEDLARINEAIKLIPDDRPPLDRVVIHTVQSDRLGFPKRKGATSEQDMVYAIGEKGEDGKLHIYVTSRYWDEVLSKNPLHLAETIDHEWQEKVLGKSHRQAAGRAWLFVKKGQDLSEYHIFIIQQILSEGFSGLLYLAGILAEERKGNYEEKFRRYIEEKIKSANPSCAILGSGDSAFYECIEGSPIIMTRTGDEARIKIEKEPVGEDDFEYTVTFIDKNGNGVGNVSFLDSGRELIINGYVLYMKDDTIKITNIKDKNSYVITETTVISEELFNEGVITPAIGYTGEVYNDKGIPSWGELLREVKKEDLVRSAVDKIKGQSGRVGNFVDIKGVSRLIVVGDLHGNYKNLMDILSRDNIWDDLKAGKAHLVILGDAIHPGSGDLTCDAAQEDSARMLLLLMKLIADLPKGSITYILGDHELSHINEGFGVTKQDVNGSYVRQDEIFEEYIKTNYGEEFLNIIKNFLKTLPYAVRINGEIVLTHAGASENLISEEHLKMLDAEDIDMLNQGLLIDIMFRAEEKREVKEREINWFLRTLNCSLLVTGHTPPIRPHADMYNFNIVKKGAIGCAYGKQLIVDSQTDSPGYIDMDMKKSDTQKGLVDLVDRDGRPALKVLGIDIVEEVVDEILGIFNKYGLKIERKDVWEAVVRAKGEIRAPPLERLFSLLKDIPQLDLKGLFALTKEISGPLNKIIPDFSEKRGGELVANVLTEILGEVEVKGREIAEGEDIREKFFNTVRKLLLDYGVTEAELAGELELIELGLFLLEYEPLLKITKVDKAYLDYLAIVCELAGVKPDTLEGIFGNAYLAYQNKETLDKLVEMGVDVDKLTKEKLELELKRKGLWSRFKRLDEIYDMMETGFTGAGVCSSDSILSRAVKRLRLYKGIVEKGIKGQINISGISGDLAGLNEVVDFKEVIVDEPKQLNGYLSGTAAAQEGIDYLVRQLGIDTNREGMVSIYEELFMQSFLVEKDRTKITYSPGIAALLKKVPGLKVEIRAKSEDSKRELEEIRAALIKNHPELGDRIRIVDEFCNKNDVLNRSEEERKQTVYVLSDENLGRALREDIKRNEVKLFCTKNMALHSAVLFGLELASIDEMFNEKGEYTEKAQKILRKLKVFYTDKEIIEKIISGNEPLIIITTAQILRQYQLYRTTIAISA